MANGEEASIHEAIVRSHISRDGELSSYMRSSGLSDESDDPVIRKRGRRVLEEEVLP